MRILAAVFFSSLLLIGCRRAEPEKPAPAAEPEEPIAETGFEIGNRAPEIVGEDIDGVEFRLSDYRGKVVVIDFWGDW